MNERQPHCPGRTAPPPSRPRPQRRTGTPWTCSAPTAASPRPSPSQTPPSASRNDHPAGRRRRPRRSSAQQQRQQQHVSPTRTSPGSCWDHGNALRSRGSSRLRGRRRSQAASYAAAIAQCYSGPRPRRSDLPRPPPPLTARGSPTKGKPNSSEPGGIGLGGVLGGGRWAAARARRIWGGGGAGELEAVEQWGIWSGAASPNPLLLLPLSSLFFLPLPRLRHLSGFFFRLCFFPANIYTRLDLNHCS